MARRQTEVRPDRLRARKAGRHVDRAPEGQRGHRADPGYRHQPPAHQIGTHRVQQRLVQTAEGVQQRPSRPQHRRDHTGQRVPAGDQLENPRLEPHQLRPRASKASRGVILILARSAARCARPHIFRAISVDL